VSLTFGMAHPEMAKGLILAATGAGAFFDKEQRREWERSNESLAQKIETQGMKAIKDEYASEAKRVQLRHKDPKGWQKYYDALGRHSDIGSAHTIRRFIIPRPTIFELEPKLKRIKIPTLILTGDEDDPCVEPSLFMKRNISHSGLVVFPQSGHTINVEEPELFNWALLDFMTSVDARSWT
jgi:pimeloyl-ACP methyl ester carboxylesterase